MLNAKLAFFPGSGRVSTSTAVYIASGLSKSWRVFTRRTQFVPSFSILNAVTDLLRFATMPTFCREGASTYAFHPPESGMGCSRS